MKHRSVALVVALVAVLAVLAVLAGCGGGGGGGDDELLSADERLAVAANLVLTDFPATGWSRSPAGVDRFGADDDRAFAICLGQDPDSQVYTANADSDTFTGPSGAQVTSAVQLAETEALAEADFRALAGDRAVECLHQRLDTQYERDIGVAPTPGTTSVERLDLGTQGAGLGDDRAAFRYRVSGRSELLVDNIFVRVGRAELSLGFVSVGSPQPAALQRELAANMVARAA